MTIIIVAAGTGSRFGGELPKQFCMLGDRPVLMHTIMQIGRALPAARLIIVLSAEYREYWLKLCEQYGFTSPQTVEGGATRWQSVRNALALVDPADDVVMVHDGARPVVPKDMLQRIAEAMKTADAAIPVIPVSDSLRQIDADGTSRALDRSTLRAVQTPQAFRASLLLDAYNLPYRATFTDDASVYEAAGNVSPTLVDGSPKNIKITNPGDLEIAAMYMGLGM